MKLVEQGSSYNFLIPALLVCRWSIGPGRNKRIISNVLAAASIAPYETDGTGVARWSIGLIEMTAAVGVPIQTGTASAGGVRVRSQERPGKRECCDNKPGFRHEGLHGSRLFIDVLFESAFGDALVDRGELGERH